MLEYLIKSIGCLLASYVFYKALLEQSSLHQLKRWFLLLSPVIALGIPLITFKEYLEVVPSAVVLTGTMTATSSTVSMPWETILWTLYLIGVVFFGIKFILGLLRMLLKVRKHTKLKWNSVFLVLLSSPTIPHTFLRYIFFEKTQYSEKTIPKEVMLHERTHAKQLHSLDLIFVELLIVVFWFNPLIYLLRKAMRLNHEFLADQAVINQGFSLSNYQNLLLAYSSHASYPRLSNSINYSFIKKRFTVMKAKTSKKASWLKVVLLLPLLALMLYGFSSTETIVVPTAETEFNEPLNELVNFQQPQEKSATRSEMKTYNRLAKKYNSMPKEERKINLADLQTLESIYRKMSAKQKANAAPFPECIPPPPPPPAPDKVTKPDNLVPPPPATPRNLSTTIPLNPPPAPDRPLEVTVPAPPNPLDHMISLAKEGADFFHEGKSISSDEAIRLLKSNSNLNISVKKINENKKTVLLTKAGVKH